MTDRFDRAQDRAIARALGRVQIEVFRLEQPSGDPPSRLRGKLGPIEVARGPGYWIADGPLPLAVADALYQHPLGRQAIRVAGRFDHPPPKAPFVVWYTAQGERVLPAAYKEPLRTAFDRWPGVLHMCPAIIFHDEPSRLGATGYIDLYHVDSDESLQVYASTRRAHDVNELGIPPWWTQHTGSRQNLARLIAGSGIDAPEGSWDGDTKPMASDDDD